MRLAARLLRIQPGEERLVALLVSLMFVTGAAIAVGESGIEALFFDRVGAAALPTMYILQGGATLFATVILTGALARTTPRRAYLAAPLVLGAVLVVERAALVGAGSWVYRLLWITVAVGALVQAIVLWGTAGSVVDTRQARRLFPIFGAGAILGSVAGGVTTRPLASAIGAPNLLLVWGGGLMATFALTRVVLGPAPPAPRRRSAGGGGYRRPAMVSEAAYVRRSSLLMWMTAAAVLFSVLFYLLYLPYARAAAQRFPNVDELAGFFGLFWAAGTATAFVVSVLATNRLYAWFGIAAMVVGFSLLYTVAFAVLLVQAGFVTLVALRFVNGVWLQGVAQPGWEALTNVVPESRRDETRAFVNGGPMQAGTMIAGVIALIGQSLTVTRFAAIGLGAGGLAVAATLGIRRSYAGALVGALRTGRPQVFEPRGGHGPLLLTGADRDAARALATSMRSPDVRTRRLAYELLPDLPIQVRPEDLSAGLDDEDVLVRLAAIRALDPAVPAGRAALLARLEDADPAVAAAAASRALGLDDPSSACLRLRALLASTDDGLRLVATQQLMLAPAEHAAALASIVLDDPAPAVRAAAIEQLAAAAPERASELALTALHDPDAAVRIAAGRALGSASTGGVAVVLAALEDPLTTDAAVEALRRLEVNGDRDRVRRFVRTTATRATRDHDKAAAIPTQDEDSRLLHDAIVDRSRRVALRGLWAATMLSSRRAEMQTAIEHLDDAPGQVAIALEAIESTSESALVRPLLALWDQVATTPTQTEWLSGPLSDDDDFIRHCAEAVRARHEGGVMPTSLAALSMLERILFLRNVPLLAELTPADLERVAALVEERGYGDGEVIGREGELGEALHIVVDGAILVVHDPDRSGQVLARRTAPEVVGEMSIITGEPRMASLVADGPARTLRLGQREFVSILRERPEVALAVMRVLAHRLAERSGGDDG